MDHDELCVAIALNPAKWAAALASNAQSVDPRAEAPRIGAPTFASARLAQPCFRGSEIEGVHDVILNYSFDTAPNAPKTSVAIEVVEEVAGNVLAIFERVQRLGSAARQHRYVVISLAVSDESLRPLFDSQNIGLLTVPT